MSSFDSMPLVTRSDLPLLALTHRADLNILTARWSCQPAAAVLPAIHDQLREDAVAMGCGYWLQDIRRLHASDRPITLWLLAHYFPQVAAELGSHLHVAYLYSPAPNQAICDAHHTINNRGVYEGNSFTVSSFSDEGSAVAWLLAQQAQARLGELPAGTGGAGSGAKANEPELVRSGVDVHAGNQADAGNHAVGVAAVLAAHQVDAPAEVLVEHRVIKKT